MTTFKDWFKQIDPEFFSEDGTRYSIDTNFRTTVDDALESYAKISLGYVSAAMKKMGFHVRQIYNEKPIRVMVSSRNWDDGEWVAMVSWNPHHKCFFVSKGFYNKDRKSISVQHTDRCKEESASEITKKVRNILHSLRHKPDRHNPKLKAVPLKRGPK
tara:strand:- start:17117 stop:17590 length:474 start_codon:yes stop_codon:yes gene_type:complete